MSEERGGRESPGFQGHQPVFLLPWIITALAGAMVAVHLASTIVFNPDAHLAFTLWFAFLPYRLIAGGVDPDLIASGGYLPILWTPVTHAFLHEGWEHLVLNVAWLMIFGTPVARRYGARNTLIVFLLSAIVGALLFAATTLPGIAFLIGASGGISGLTGAATRFIFQPVLVAQDPITHKPRVLGRRLAPLRSLMSEPRTRFFILFWVILNGAAPLLPLLTGAPVQIAWQAHLGGFLAGLLIVGVFERRERTGQ